ncbi:MAG: hypothetical protein KDA84_27275 [Planctomycetaceae bacterium]|nr:hypothetical protein [Planctomycetaceae bacterium]
MKQTTFFLLSFLLFLTTNLTADEYDENARNLIFQQAYSGSGVISGFRLTKDSDTKFSVYPGVAHHSDKLNQKQEWIALNPSGVGGQLRVDVPGREQPVANGHHAGGAYQISLFDFNVQVDPQSDKKFFYWIFVSRTGIQTKIEVQEEKPQPEDGVVLGQIECQGENGQLKLLSVRKATRKTLANQLNSLVVRQTVEGDEVGETTAATIQVTQSDGKKDVEIQVHSDLNLRVKRSGGNQELKFYFKNTDIYPESQP